MEFSGHRYVVEADLGLGATVPLMVHGNVPEAALTSFGMLGFDWMKEHAAILDYGNLRLYFRP